MEGGGGGSEMGMDDEVLFSFSPSFLPFSPLYVWGKGACFSLSPFLPGRQGGITAHVSFLPFLPSPSSLPSSPNLM